MTDELFASCLAAYLDGLDTTVVEDRFVAWAKSDGLAVAHHSGFVFAHRASRITAFYVPFNARRQTEAKSIPAERCWTCGAWAVGSFDDGSPRFDCYVHDPDRHVPTTSEVPLWKRT